MNEGPLQPKLKTVEPALGAWELRCRRVAELKERVQQGLYSVSSQELAEKLLLTAAREPGRTLMLCEDALGSMQGASRGGEGLAHDPLPWLKTAPE